MRIIDAHHHIWRQTDLPWLIGPSQPRIFGGYDAIKRDYPVEEYVSDVTPHDVEKSIYIQVNWAPNWFVDEVAWVQATADRTGWPHGIVGYCDLTQKDARRDLDRLKAYPLMRGIRQQLHWHENPQYRFAKVRDVARNPNFIRNAGYLADYGWSFDLQLFAQQFETATELIQSNSKIPFILQHAGMLDDASEEGRQAWREQMKKLARNKNVYAKLSGFGTFIRKNDPAHIKWMVDETTTIFGEKRCLFGSNFPIEKIWTGYGRLINAFLDATADWPRARREAVFNGTARKLYRL